MTREDLHALEEARHEFFDDGRQQYEALVATAIGGQWHDAWQRARCLHDRQRRFATEGVFAVQADHEVQALVLDPRKGSRRIERQRRQNRLDFLFKIIGQPVAGCLRPFAARHEYDTGLAQCRQQHLAEAGILLGDQTSGAVVNGGELASRRQTIRAQCGR